MRGLFVTKKEKKNRLLSWTVSLFPPCAYMCVHFLKIGDYGVIPLIHPYAVES